MVVTNNETTVSFFSFFSKNIGATLELNYFMTSVKEHPVWHILEMWSIFEILVWVSVDKLGGDSRMT